MRLLTEAANNLEGVCMYYRFVFQIRNYGSKKCDDLPKVPQ